MKYYYDITNKNEVGVDECARGVVFGRIYGAAVIFPKSIYVSNVNENASNVDGNASNVDGNETIDPNYDKKLEDMIMDSKQLSRKNRDILYNYIKKRAIDYSVGYYDESVIDEKGIQYCNMTVFHDCINNLRTKPDFILVDGISFWKHDSLNHLCIKKGDSKYLSIACASILAKVEHDNYINELCKNNKELTKYDLLNNMGYGTKKHIDAIRQYGYTKHHRKSYKIKSLMTETNNK